MSKLKFEDFDSLKDAEEYIKDLFENKEDEIYLVHNVNDDENYLVFLDEYDVEEYLVQDYESNAPDLTFESYVSDMEIYIYVSFEEKEKWSSRYRNSEVAFDSEMIYKKKIHADAEYEIRVSLGYY